MKHFKAPWGTSLILMSVLATLLFLGVTIWRCQPFTAAQLSQFPFWLSTSGSMRSRGH